MSEPVIWEITMPGKPTQQFIPLAFHKQKLNAIQAEVERLRASSFVTAVPVEEYEKLKAELTNCKSEADRLKAEVERLREAGDAMHSYLGRVDGTTNGQLQVRQDWDEAKEGKPSV